MEPLFGGKPRVSLSSRFAGRPTAWTATLAYAVLTLALTWPLPLGLAKDVPMDLADPLLNAWIVGWGAEHVRRFASGDLAAFAGFWNANIFYPAPLTLTYSEHLFAQALQAAPVYAATRNVILCYNLLFLSTFVLSGLGLFLLLRDITGDALAAFSGGLLFAFAPYRFEHASHLQLLSLQWLPFALLGIRRFVRTGRLRPLAFGTLALVAHGLSCGYYLLFFSPFVAAYVLHEMRSAGRLRSRRHWLGLALAAGLDLLVTLPFLMPYVQARDQIQTIRGSETVRQFSADLAAWATATPMSRLWGSRLSGLDRAEGHLFPGVTPVLLGLVAVTGATLAFRRTQASPRRPMRMVATGLACVALGLVAANHLPKADHGTVLVRGPGFVATPMGILQFGLAALLAALALSAGFRRLAARAFSSYTGFCVGSCILGVWLSLGGEPRLWGLDLGLPGAYSFLHDYVPGFDGLRAPARYAAVVVLFLSLLAGLGVARLRRHRFGTVATLMLLGAFLVECACVPLPLNMRWGLVGMRPPPAPGRVAEPPVYAVVRTLPRDAVLLELPVGEVLWETHAMIRSTRHWRRLVNGYSGHFPRGYVDVRAAFAHALEDPDKAWEVLRASGATHVLVHGRAWYRERVGEKLTRDLEARGASVLFGQDGDVLLALPPVSSPPRDDNTRSTHGRGDEWWTTPTSSPWKERPAAGREGEGRVTVVARQ
jgi:hypothetical protein